MNTVSPTPAPAEAGEPAPLPDDRLPTYQELLDHAVNDTFPASDPIAPHAATHTGPPVETPRDGDDWAIEPETPCARLTRCVVAEFDDDGAAHAAMASAIADPEVSAHLDTSPERSGTTLTVIVNTGEQLERAWRIAGQAGAASVRRVARSKDLP
jgi:hypothetical protein